MQAEAASCIHLCGYIPIASHTSPAQLTSLFTYAPGLNQALGVFNANPRQKSSPRL